VDLSGIKVHVVDDEPDARDLIRRVVIDCYAEVCTAGTAKEALRPVEKGRPHILVTDRGSDQGSQRRRALRRL